MVKMMICETTVHQNHLQQKSGHQLRQIKLIDNEDMKRTIEEIEH